MLNGSDFGNFVLIVGIIFVTLQQIRFVGTHSEYDMITDIQHI